MTRRAKIFALVHEIDDLRSQIDRLTAQVATKERELDAVLGERGDSDQVEFRALSPEIPDGTPRASYDFLIARAGEVCTAQDVAIGINANLATTRSALSRLASRGVIDKARGVRGGYVLRKRERPEG